MSEHKITVQGGSTVRLPTAGKYCDRDILVSATPGGVDLPELTNEGSAPDLMEGKQMISGEGVAVTGSFTLADELSAQNTLIEQIKTALAGKAAGGGNGDLPAGYKQVDYIQFNGKQLIDTGIIGNQNTQINVSFTWENSTQRHLFGCASSDNTASITSYMNGSWRFGNKYASKNFSLKKPKLPYTALVNNTEISTVTSAATISGVNDFETVGTLLLGGARDTDGSLPSVGIVGKVFYFNLWQGDVLVRKLVPVVSAEGVYRFWDRVSQTFFDSVTDTPLEGGNI